MFGVGGASGGEQEKLEKAQVDGDPGRWEEPGRKWMRLWLCSLYRNNPHLVKDAHSITLESMCCPGVPGGSENGTLGGCQPCCQGTVAHPLWSLPWTHLQGFEAVVASNNQDPWPFLPPPPEPSGIKWFMGTRNPWLQGQEGRTERAKGPSSDHLGAQGHSTFPATPLAHQPTDRLTWLRCSS